MKIPADSWKEKIPDLTRSQRRLLEFILNHPDESIFLTAADLAARTSVSVATVVRLGRALGFPGFSDFQARLRVLFRNQFKTTSRLQNTARRISHEGEILHRVLQADMDNISETLKQVSPLEFRACVQGMAKADRIIIVGLRSVYSLAIFLGVALEFLQKIVWVVQPGVGDLWDRLIGMRKGDLVIAISFPRYTRLTVEVLRFARHRRIRTLAITDSLTSPLIPFADHFLTSRYKMDSFIESFTAPLSLINALVTALGIHNQKKTLKSLRELETLWEKHQVYWSP